MVGRSTNWPGHWRPRSPLTTWLRQSPSTPGGTSERRRWCCGCVSRSTASWRSFVNAARTRPRLASWLWQRCDAATAVWARPRRALAQTGAVKGTGPGVVQVAVPLISRGLTVGALGLALEPGNDWGERLSLVDVFGGLCSTALDRALLYLAEHEARQTLEFLAAATQLMISAVDPDEVVDHLVHLAVPRLGDWCTAYLADGRRLRRVAMAIDGYPELAEHLKAEPLSLEVDVPQTRAYRRGVLEPIPSGVGRLLTRLYPDLDFSAIGGDLEGGSGLCAPILLPRRAGGGDRSGFPRLGAPGHTSHGGRSSWVGRARAAMALDYARRWSDQRRVVHTLVDALLPHQAPTVPGYELAARYIPSGGGVAGDWWEADLMPDGTLLLGVGDAAGHGMAGASLMAELRHGARALAAIGRGRPQY